ncbi:hypothetical protein F4814DRAFT_163009 [Daldinia grandis]|nr:hypothetical protein F4814DRAFT_163009 [Daldinia grandis]
MSNEDGILDPCSRYVTCGALLLCCCCCYCCSYVQIFCGAGRSNDRLCMHTCRPWNGSMVIEESTTACFLGFTRSRYDSRAPSRSAVVLIFIYVYFWVCMFVLVCNVPDALRGARFCMRVSWIFWNERLYAISENLQKRVSY